MIREIGLSSADVSYTRHEIGLPTAKSHEVYELGVSLVMTGLSSQTAIEEFVKQGVHNRIVKRAIWPAGNMLVLDGNDVYRLNTEGTMSERTDEDLDATDWFLDEGEFLNGQPLGDQALL